MSASSQAAAAAAAAAAANGAHSYANYAWGMRNGAAAAAGKMDMMGMAAAGMSAGMAAWPAGAAAGMGMASLPPEYNR